MRQTIDGLQSDTSVGIWTVFFHYYHEDLGATFGGLGRATDIRNTTLQQASLLFYSLTGVLWRFCASRNAESWLGGCAQPAGVLKAVGRHHESSRVQAVGRKHGERCISWCPFTGPILPDAHQRLPLSAAMYSTGCPRHLVTHTFRASCSMAAETPARLSP